VNQNFLREMEETVERIYRPDLSQMIPYKPKVNIMLVLVAATL